MRTAFLFSALIWIVSAAACRPSSAPEAREVAPELKLQGVEFRIWRGPDLHASGKASSVALRRDSTEIWARDVAVSLPRPEGTPVQVSAPAGEGTLQARTFSARGGVTVVRGGDVTRTERARYEPGPGGGTVRGDDPVVVEGRGYRLEGTGFTLDPASGDMDVGGPARLLAGLREGR
jgi:lipopolysaccharide export system protein LptC